MNNYYDDSPITSKEQDLLSRGRFSSGLAKSLLEMNADNGLCVALYGPWGSGKTSILNMIVEELNDSSNDEQNTVVLRFEPWRFTSEEQLFHQFFIMLAHAFSDSKDEKINNIANEIEEYVRLAEAIDGRAKVVTLLYKKAKKRALKNNIYDQDLAKQKDLIIERILGSARKIIVLIDDIDRLSSSEIKLLFKLVKSVADFPNTIYLMAFDRKVVASALTETNVLDGEEYLEKIIQVPIEIPALRESEVSKILLSKLDDIITTFNVPCETTRFQHAYYECIDTHLHSLREINRLANLMYTKCMIAGNNVDFIDLLVLSLVELQYPDIYAWIKGNKERLVGGERYSFKTLGKDDNAIGEENDRIIEQLNPSNKDYYLDVLTFLFPNFKMNGKYGREYFSESVLRRSQRVGHPAFFDHYFCLGLNTGELARETVDRALFKMEYNELESFVDSINGTGTIDDFLKEMQAALPELLEDRKRLLAHLLIRKANTFYNSDGSNFFYLDPKSRARYLIEKIIESLEEDSSELILGELKNADEDTLYLLAGLINSTELAYGKLAANGEKREDCTPVVAEDRLGECEQTFVNRWKALSEKVDWLNVGHFNIVLYLLKCFDKEAYDAYVSEEIKSDLGLLKYVQLSAEKITGTSEISYKYSDDYQEYVDDAIVLETIERCVNDRSLFTLSHKLIVRILAFKLWVDREDNFDEPRLRDIEKLIEEYEGRQ